MRDTKKRSSGSPLIPIAILTAMVGGIGAAVITNPKNEKLKRNLEEIGDSVVDACDSLLSRIEAKTSASSSHGLSKTSQSLLEFFDEVKILNKAVAEPIHTTFPEKVQEVVAKEVAIVSHAVTEVHHVVDTVEEKASEISSDISDKIAWLQKKGRSLARKKY